MALFTEQADQVDDVHLNVAIFTKSEVLRRGLESILRDLPIVDAVYYCDCWPEVQTVLSTRRPDVLVIADPEHEAAPIPVEVRAKTLMLIDGSDVRNAVIADAIPPDGFLVQEDLTPTGLNDALRRITAGEIRLPAELARELMIRASTPAPRPHSRLTARERETLSLLAEGFSNKQIARRLGISSHGAKRLVASLLLKLDSPNRTTAVVTAIKTGLINYS